jgi:hypothetical protein
VREKSVTDTGQAAGRSRARDYDVGAPTAWAGWVVFAAVMMMMVGGFHAIAGFVALFDDGYYVTRPSGLVLSVDYTSWGWIHLLMGVLVFLAGLALLAGQAWARALGVVLAALSAFANMAFIAAYPLWSIIIITLDVIVIYAIVVHGREVKSMV